MRNPSVQSVHAVLDYLLTRAGHTGEVKSVKVRIPHHELVGEKTEYEDLDLVITIHTDWEQTKDGESDFEEITDEA